VSGSSAITSDDPTAPNPAGEMSAWTSFEEALGRLQRGEPSAALRLLKPLVEAHPYAPVFQSSYAEALKDAGDAAAAVRVYKAAVKRWPGSAALFHDLAVAAREAGDIAEATRAEQAALALDDTSAMPTPLPPLNAPHSRTHRTRRTGPTWETRAAHWAMVRRLKRRTAGGWSLMRTLRMR
jgi:tetratricopeptide (TPR) repeat protein